jgi:hypothetical protein
VIAGFGDVVNDEDADLVCHLAQVLLSIGDRSEDRSKGRDHDERGTLWVRRARRVWAVSARPRFDRVWL